MRIWTTKWNQDQQDVKLFDGDRMCLMAFYGLTQGLTHHDMRDKVWLSECFNPLPANLRWLLEPVQWGQHKFSSAQIFLSWLNDTPDKNKRANIEKFFKRVGVSKIKWID